MKNVKRNDYMVPALNNAKNQRLYQVPFSGNKEGVGGGMAASAMESNTTCKGWDQSQYSKPTVKIDNSLMNTVLRFMTDEDNQVKYVNRMLIVVAWFIFTLFIAYFSILKGDEYVHLVLRADSKPECYTAVELIQNPNFQGRA